MRRLVILVALALVLAGCGRGDEQEPGDGGTGPATTQQSDPYDY